MYIVQTEHVQRQLEEQDLRFFTIPARYFLGLHSALQNCSCRYIKQQQCLVVMKKRHIRQQSDEMEHHRNTEIRRKEMVNIASLCSLI